MMSCSEIRPRIALYVDREVAGAEALEFEAHLTECAECRREFDDLRETVDAVRGASPIYEVPERSNATVGKIVADWERRQRQRRWVPALVGAALGIAMLVAWWVSAGQSGYEQFAAQAHRNYARRTFPLDIVSSQPQVVSDWLVPRVPFHLKLPDYPEGRPKPYVLAGARLMQYRGEDVAYLAYEMNRKPISLLISSSSRVVPSGGESYESAGLTFYFSSEQGLRIITWKDKGLTYAQVSDLDVKGAESCAICHGAEGERRKFEGLGKRM
jgi:anti-sigma factor RsiW